MRPDETYCGFSCTYAKKKIQKVLDELAIFAEHNPEIADRVTDDIVLMVNEYDTSRKQKKHNPSSE